MVDNTLLISILALDVRGFSILYQHQLFSRERLISKPRDSDIWKMQCCFYPEICWARNTSHTDWKRAGLNKVALLVFLRWCVRLSIVRKQREGEMNGSQRRAMWCRGEHFAHSSFSCIKCSVPCLGVTITKIVNRCPLTATIRRT